MYPLLYKFRTLLCTGRTWIYLSTFPMLPLHIALLSVTEAWGKNAVHDNDMDKWSEQRVFLENVLSPLTWMVCIFRDPLLR